MNKNFPRQVFLLLGTTTIALVLWRLSSSAQTPTASKQNAVAVKVATASEAQNFQTQPHDFIIYAAQENGQQKPKFVVRADYLKYPQGLSYQNFVPQDTPKTPEEALALTKHLLRTPTSQFENFKDLFEKDLTDSKVKNLENVFAALKKNPAGIRDETFYERYDVGSLSYLTTNVIYNPDSPFAKALPHAYLITRQAKERAFVENKSVLDFNVVNFTISLSDTDSLSNQPATDWKLPYKLQIPSLIEQDPPDLHPLFILFNGKPANVPLKELKADDPDPILSAFYQLRHIELEGTEKEWLALWTDSDAEKIMDKDPARFRNVRHRFNHDYLRVFFVMDLGSVAAVFVEDRWTDEDQAEIKMFKFFKKDNNYLLTNGVDLPNGKSTFPGNLQGVLASKTFETFLRGIAKQTGDPDAKLVNPREEFEREAAEFLKETSPKKAP